MKKMFLALLLLLPAVASAQQPVRVRTLELGDSTRFTITWASVPGATTYDVLAFSNPRNLLVEQLRVVTGNAWTITVPRVADSTRIYVSVRVSNPTTYASITYRLPAPGAAVRPNQ